MAWLSTPKNEGGISGVSYPIVSDIHKTIARDYGVLSFDAGIAYRGVFLIDREGVVRHQTVNDFPIGRCIDEEIRSLDALIFHENHGDVCPANWQKGAKAMAPNDHGLKSFFASE